MVLRVVGYSALEFYVADDGLGYTLIPGMNGWYTKESRTFVSINSDGFRDDEHAVAKPEGALRVAVIGDSYVEGFQVPDDQLFTTFLADEVQKCGGFGGGKLEILKFGVSGYGTGQELLVLRDKVWKYKPDIVLLLITTNNDITDNSRYFKKVPIPYFRIGEGGLVLDDSFKQEAAFIARSSRLGRTGTWLKNHARLVQAVGAIATAVKYRYQEWKAGPAPQVVPTQDVAAEVGVDNQIYRRPADANWEQAWRVTEALIAQMKDEVESRAAKFVVVTGSNGVQVLPNVDERAAFAKRLGVDDLYYPDRRIAEFCRAHSISAITLAPILAQRAARDKVNLHGFEGNLGYGHWNQLGHRVAGEEIGKRLCDGGYR